MWTVVPLLLGLTLTLAAMSRKAPMYFRFDEGGILAEIVAGLGMLALVYGAIAGRRGFRHRWLVAAPMTVLWIGMAGVALQAGGLREFIAYDIEPELHERVFLEGIGEVLHVSGLASMFGALLFVQVAGFLFLVELEFLGARARLAAEAPVFSLVKFA